LLLGAVLFIYLQYCPTGEPYVDIRFDLYCAAIYSAVMKTLVLFIVDVLSVVSMMLQKICWQHAAPQYDCSVSMARR